MYFCQLQRLLLTTEAADCVYFEPAFPLLQQTLRDLIGPKTMCYFCFKKRRRADMHFMRRVKKDFIVEDVDDDPDRNIYARENITLCVSNACYALAVSEDHSLTSRADAPSGARSSHRYFGVQPVASWSSDCRAIRISIRLIGLD